MNGSIDEMSFANGLKMTTYPNPAVNNVTLAYELQNNAKNVLVRILDATGKVVEQMNLGTQTAGQYNINLDVNNYAAGTYYFLVNAGSDRMAIKMNITK
jgi:flagellar hook assembly protein FlgD